MLLKLTRFDAVAAHSLRLPQVIPTLQQADHRRHDPALDGLRGLAVLMVFVFHYGGGLQSTHMLIRGLGYITETGWIGVILFFALSGFLITGGLWDSRDEPHVLLNFYARRALRILPLYYFALAVAFIAAVISATALSNLRSFSIYIFFLQDLPFLATRAAVYSAPLPLYHLWSLAVEEQFYLLWPALILLVRTRRAALNLSLGIFILSTLFRVAIWGPAFSTFAGPGLFDQFLLTHAGALALGAALALALRADALHSAALNRASVFTLIGGTLLYLCISLYCHTFLLKPHLQFTIGLVGITLAATAIIPIALREGLIRSALSIGPLCWLGRFSYGLYVFHLLLRPLFDSFAVRLSHATSGTFYQGIRFVVAFFITLAVAWASFHFCEQPILALKRRFPMVAPLPKK